MIFLVTTIVLAMLLCGAVSAQDPDGSIETGQQQSNSTDNLEETTDSQSTNNQGTDLDPRIYGVIDTV